MLTITLDAQSPLTLKWPKKPADILHLTERFLAKQVRLDAAAQLKDVPLATIQTLYTQALEATGGAMGSEATRAASAESLRQHLETAKEYIDLIQLRLKGKYAQNLALLEAWGFDTMVGKHGINLRKPTKPNAIIAFLQAYVAKEASLPPDERLTDPPLETLETLLNEMQTAHTTRTTGRDQRELNIETRTNALEELLNWLQVAAAILVMQNGGRITNVLQEHGFIVVERTGPKPAPTEAMA